MPEVSKLLVERGADVNHIDSDDHPILLRAFNKDDISTAKLLLAKGATIQPSGLSYGDESLLFAALCGKQLVALSRSSFLNSRYNCRRIYRYG